MKKEIYKDISGFENYQVSTLGNVLSKNYKRLGITKQVKQNPHTYGYLIVTLFTGGQPEQFLVHRLVLLTFVGKPPKNMRNPICNHINGDVADNRLENLEWICRSTRTSSKAPNWNPNSLNAICNKLFDSHIEISDSYKNKGSFYGGVRVGCKRAVALYQKYLTE